MVANYKIFTRKSTQANHVRQRRGAGYICIYKLHATFFEEINGALRCREEHYLVDLIDSGLRKLPIHFESLTHRWAKIGDDLQLLLSQGVMINLGYTSTNLHPHRYDGSDFDTDSMRIFMHLGRDISLYSDDNSLGLQELLIPRGASFRLLAQDFCPEFMYDLLQIA